MIVYNNKTVKNRDQFLNENWLWANLCYPQFTVVACFPKVFCWKLFDMKPSVHVFVITIDQYMCNDMTSYCYAIVHTECVGFG